MPRARTAGFVVEAPLLDQRLIEVDVVPLQRTAVAGKPVVALTMLRMADDESDPSMPELEEVLGHVVRCVLVGHGDPREPVKRSLGHAHTGDVALQQKLVEALHVGQGLENDEPVDLMVQADDFAHQVGGVRPARVDQQVVAMLATCP